MRVADTDRKAASFHLGCEVQHAEHLHSIGRNGIFLGYDSDLSETQGLNQGFDNRMVCNRFVG